MLKVDFSNASVQVDKYVQGLAQANTWLQEASGRGNDFVGWVNLPRDYDKEEYARIKAAAKKIQSDSKALVVVGIGGSYLGARSAIELLCSNNYNLKKKDTPNIYFAGNGLSGDALQEIIDLIGEDDFSVNVISKSGTTTEPAVAFRFFKELMEKKYGKAEAAKRIYWVLGCKGFARVDLFLTPEGELVFNEVNTIPGFTPYSRYPNMMKQIGLSYGEVVERLI